ncbi:MAG: FG-GAP repeat domain-containing protein, partial [Gemmatimonadota bacterium]
GGGRVQEPCQAISTGSATTITMADVNGDRALDLLVPHRDGGQGVVLVNDGRGGFPTRVPFGPAQATIRAAQAADFDGDGVMDLVAIDELGSALLMRGERGGRYAAAESLGPVGQKPYALTVGDVDANGRPDVVVGYTNARPIVYFNDGPGRFTPVAFGDAQGIAYGITIADLNEDRVMDLVVARSDAPNIVYFGAH